MFNLKMLATIWGSVWVCISIFVVKLSAQPMMASILKKEINNIIRNEQPINFDLVPGALIGVFIEDSSYVFAVGQAPGKEAVFELGSLTKPVIAYLVNQVRTDNQFINDDLICHFLPDTLCQGAWKQVSLGQLLSHRCGLPKITPSMAEEQESISDPYKTYDIGDLADDMKGIEPTPGRYSYAHMNYMVLSWFLESKGGLENIRRTHLEQELGLISMQFDVPDSLITAGYGMNGQARTPWHTKAMAPAVGLKSNITDMLEFIRLASRDKDAPVMTKDMKRDLEAKAKKEIFEMYKGWFLVPSGKNLMGFHTGHTGGHHTSAAFVFGKNIGVVVCSNGASGSGDLSIRVLEMMERGE